MLCLKSNFVYCSSLYVLLADSLQLQFACFYLSCVFCAEFGCAGIVNCYDLYGVSGLGHFLDRSAGEGYVYVAVLGPAVVEFVSIIKKIDVVC